MHLYYISDIKIDYVKIFPMPPFCLTPLNYVFHSCVYSLGTSLLELLQTPSCLEHLCVCMSQSQPIDKGKYVWMVFPND